MPSSRSTVVDVTYDDPRTGERVRERKIQTIPYEELEEVRNRELALVAAPRTTGDPAPQQQQQQREISRYRAPDENNNNDDDDNYYTVHRRRTAEYTRDRVPHPSRRNDDRYDRRPRRQSYDAYDSSSSSSRSHSRRRRSRRDRDRHPSSPPRSTASKSSSKNTIRENPAHIQDQEDDGVLWYSGKARSDGNFFEKNFDSSYDGILAAAAGAAMGVVTARHYAEGKNKKAKTLGAAAAGAVAFNAGENWFRIFTEEREERKERKEERRREGEGR